MGGILMKLIYHVFIPLLIGILIYIMFRSNQLRMFNWFEVIKIDKFLNRIRDVSMLAQGFVPGWIKYSLPDGLWSYSFSSSISLLWNSETKPIHLQNFLFLVVIGTEVLQLFRFAGGTFDLLDILFCISGVYLGLKLSIS